MNIKVFKNVFFIFSCVLFVLSSVRAYATSEIGTLDTIHYIPPIYARSGLSTNNDVRDHYLQLSTLETDAFNVTITNANGTVNQTVSLSKSSPQNIILSDTPYGSSSYGALNIVTSSDVNTINDTDGLVVSAAKRFYANIRHSSGAQGGSLVAKGNTALGQRFRSGHVYTNTQQLPVKSHFISVMAVADNTTIDFSDISPGITFVSATPTSIELDQYESYVVAVELDTPGNELVANDLNGTLVTSNKPIVMNSGSFLAGHSTETGSGRDIGIDQIVPTNYLGTRFIPAIGGGGANAVNMEVPIVVADTDNTSIFINGSATAIATIDAGEYYPISGTNFSNGSMFIRTSHPAYLYQSTSSNSNNGQAMNFVAAIFDNLEPQDLVVPDVGQLGTPTISIIAPSSATITLDGSNLTGGASVPGTAAFLLYTVTGETGDVEVTSTSPFSYTMTSEEGARGASAYYVGFPNSYAINDNVTTQALSAITIDVQANDVSGNNTFTVETPLVVTPNNGMAVINANGTITYTPNAGFTSDSFTYRINNGAGISDDAVVTIELDTDSDGVADVRDVDSDNDGILDSIEDANSPISNDTDGDGVEDKFDLDSDNDGIFDLVEAGHNQPDTNNDGRIDNTVFSGDNGYADVLETVAESGITNYSLASTDGDNLENYIDLDSDGDGLPDNIEAQVAASYIVPNQSYTIDGVDTAYLSGLLPVNTFNATNADYINTNTDGQGANDTIEAGLTLSGVIGSNGLDNAIDSADNYIDVNGNINNPNLLPDEDNDNQLDFRDDNGFTPTDILIDGGNTDTVAENTPSGSSVGILTTTDNDSGDTFSYTLVSGIGSEDNARFAIVDDALNLAFTPDFESPQDTGDTPANNTYSIRVRSTDSYNLSYEEVIIVTISDVDEIAPSIQIQNTPSTTNAAFTSTFQFSEPVNNFTLSDIAVVNGAASNFNSVDADTYTALITPQAQGDVTIGVDSGVANDNIGNNNTAAIPTVARFDNIAPTIQIQNIPTNTNSAFTATFKFNEDVNDFTQSDIDVGNGVPSDFTALNANTYTALITPTTQGAVTIDVASNAATDNADNGNTAAIQVSTQFDNARPSIEIQNVPDNINSPVTATFQFSENVSNFIQNDIRLSNGVISNFTVTDANTYTALITPTAEGVVTVDVSSNVAVDNAGNGNVAAIQVSSNFDINQPSVQIQNVPDDTNSAFTATFKFNENVNNFALNDVSVTNGAASNLTTIDRSTYTALITPTAQGLVTLDIPSNSAVDDAGNANTAAPQANSRFDVTAPSVQIQNVPTHVNTSFTVTFAFSEDVNNFTLNDIIVPDVIEAGLVDTNMDGLVDNAIILTVAPDTDGSGDPDYIDADSDNDGFNDIFEAGNGALDQDNDGQVDNMLDADQDGVFDIVDGDTSGFGNQLDSDGDGIADLVDNDDDNDGISDDLERASLPTLTGNDTDGDGIDDAIDVTLTKGIDANRDGIDDALDGDTDNDGIPDTRDTDTDNDGIPDIIEIGDGVNIDTDNDGIPNFKDIDSDNDGINDGNEDNRLPPLTGRDADSDGIDDALDVDLTGGVDTNLNGIDDEFEPSDIDRDGLADYLDTDADNDRIPDIIEGNRDSDGDGLIDSQDTDSDNDGIPDVIEAANFPVLSGLDSDNDGIDDAIDITQTMGEDNNNNGIDDQLELADSDNDGLFDIIDPDSDGDGIPDRLEAPAVIDLIGLDSDGDGIDDFIDPDQTGGRDVNGDGIDDSIAPIDTDQDGIPNYTDNDSDNDGIADGIEAGVSGLDSDGDGIDDTFDVDHNGGVDANNDGIADNVTIINTDSDAVPDYIDLDSDNDGVNDVIEAGLIDINNDGIADEGVSMGLPLDDDGDSIPNYRDLDSDNDGQTDLIEAGNELLDTNNDGRIDNIIDIDNDGILDVADNELNQFGGSLDTDRDGIPNRLDLDDDNDGIVDTLEVRHLPELANRDDNNNGIDDAIDALLTGGRDVNNDGIDDVLSGDTDGDGVADTVDLDSDNDGIPDSLESGNPSMIDDDANGMIDNFIDANEDGLDDRIDASLLAVNTDDEALPDYQDLDADNDGISDLIEGGSLSALDMDNNGQIDAQIDRDGDGIIDTVDVAVRGHTSGTRPQVADTDGDGIKDYRDLDSDGDGFDDVLEAGDFDNDGVIDSLNNNEGGLETAVSGAGSLNKISLIFLICVLFLRAYLVGLYKRHKYHKPNIVIYTLIATVLSSVVPHGHANSDMCAAYERDIFNKCWYVGAGIGRSYLNPEGEVNGWRTDDNNSEGLGVHIGYKFTPHWYSELSYIDAGEAGLGNRNPMLDQAISDAAITYVIPSLAIGYYLWDKPYGWNLYGKSGLSVIKTQATDNRIGEETQSTAQLTFGLGAQYRFNRSPWFAQLQLDSFDRDARFISIRLSRHLRFSASPHPSQPQPIIVAPVRVMPVEKIISDADKGGIPDTVDQCFSTPSNTAVDSIGCPVFNGVIEGVHFETSQAILTSSARQILSSVSNTLKQYPTMRIEVQAYTDNRGSRHYNKNLSQRRAQSVVNFLNKQGINLDRLVSKGYGEALPIATNNTPAGQAQNRRVELHVIKTAEDKAKN